MPTSLSAKPPELRPREDPRDATKWWRERVDSPLFVYFIQDGEDGAVKIGKAFNPTSRLSELQCGNPRPLNLRNVVLAHDATEADLHSAWREYRNRGEWFGGADRYRVYGCWRTPPRDAPIPQVEILRLAQEAQDAQIDAALAGVSEAEIKRIAMSTVRPIS